MKIEGIFVINKKENGTKTVLHNISEIQRLIDKIIAEEGLEGFKILLDFHIRNLEYTRNTSEVERFKKESKVQKELSKVCPDEFKKFEWNIKQIKG